MLLNHHKNDPRLPPAWKRGSNLPQSVTEGPARWHAEGPSVFDSRGVFANHSAIIVIQLVQPIARRFGAVGGLKEEARYLLGLLRQAISP